MAVVCPSVCLSVRPSVPYLTLSWEGRAQEAENWQEESPWHGSPVTLFRGRKVWHLPGEFCVFYRNVNVQYDLQAESCAWLFKSLLAGGGGILCQLRYRPHSLFSSYDNFTHLLFSYRPCLICLYAHWRHIGSFSSEEKKLIVDNVLV